jgi:hypothetical protein
VLVVDEVAGLVRLYRDSREVRKRFGKPTGPKMHLRFIERDTFNKVLSHP